MDRKLAKLLGPSLVGIRLIDGPIDESYDYQCALMTLPAVFETTVETIPTTGRYLSADAERSNKWRHILGKDGIRVGIAWQGKPNVRVDIGRSIPLRTFQPLSEIANVHLISLQKNHGLDQLTDLPPGMRVETLGEDFDGGPDAFIDTAAVMENLDLIVTSDTSIAHLAGALGRPVWVALKHVPDWRWMLDRDDSPWYPSMRLYRQSVRGEWGDVFARMADDLRDLVENGRASESNQSI